MFLYSVWPSRIDQVIQCDLLHVTAYVTARVPILFIVYTDTQKKVRVISFLPSDMMHVHSSEVARPKMPISNRCY